MLLAFFVTNVSADAVDDTGCTVDVGMALVVALTSTEMVERTSECIVEEDVLRVISLE